jgi:hypothetical protein
VQDRYLRTTILKTIAGWRRAAAPVLLTLSLAVLAAGLLNSSARADGPLSEEDEYDPTARLTQFQFKDIYTPAEYGTNAQPNTFQARTILAIDPFWFMPLEQLLRPTVDMKTVPVGRGPATVTGYDDMQLLDLFVLPWPNFAETHFRWAIGPYFVFPTSSDPHVGNGSWQLGPAFAFGYRGVPGLQLAGLMQQATSFAYTSSRSLPVTSLSFQPIITYKLDRGWYLKSSDATWTFNLRHHQSTTIPLCAGLGKVWKLEEGFAVDTSVSGEWMVYRQFSNQTEQTTINFQVTLLLPQLSL